MPYIDLMNFISALVGALGVVVGQKIQWYLDNPYRWKCPESGCTFVLSSNSEQWVTSMKEDHKHG